MKRTAILAALVAALTRRARRTRRTSSSSRPSSRAPPRGRLDTEGEVQGAFTTPDQGNACGWEDVADVLNAMAAGDAYVNVHTTQHRGGQIRGQVEAG